MDAALGGRRLRALRVGQHITLEQLEKLTGVPKQRISDIELGKVNNPGFKEVVRIARGLGLSVEQAAQLYELQ